MYWFYNAFFFSVCTHDFNQKETLGSLKLRRVTGSELDIVSTIKK